MMVSSGQNRLTRRTWVLWAKWLVLIYCLVGIVIYYLQDYIILHPTRLQASYQYQLKHPYREVNLAYDATTNINIVQFEAQRQPVRGVVLYFHGNRGNVQRYQRFVPRFAHNGYEVWMIDYPGFGKSTGEFTEKMAYDWSLVMYNLARKRFATDSIIIYGKSLGTGLAAQLASVRDCRQLVLETPYNSLTSVAETWFWMYPLNQMLHFKFPTYQYLTKVTAPVTIFHGTEDGVIPYDNAKLLKPVLKKGDDFITVDGGTHRNLNSFSAVQQKLDGILNR